jgi:hypothetical protein
MDEIQKSLEFYASVLHEINDEAVESHLFSFDSSLGLGGDDLRRHAADLLRRAAARCTSPRAERLLRAADSVVRGEPCARNQQGLSWQEASQVNTCILEEWEKLTPHWPSDKPPEIPHLDLWDLFPGLVVRIGQDFEDYSREPLHAGELLHFKELDYFAKEGGFTLTFAEKELRFGELIPANGPMIENDGNAYFAPYPNIESDIDRCGRWLEQKGKRDAPPVCTNSALASSLFPFNDIPETEGLPFQITFLFAGIVRCPDGEVPEPEIVTEPRP